MSKEFEELAKRLWDSSDESDYKYSDLQAAFTTGRALGRREMKEAVRLEINEHACAECDYLVPAIEAIPEET